MLSVIKNIISVVVFFFFLEYLLYVRDYNDLLITNCYVKYELKENGQLDLSGDKYELIINEDGSYCLILHRDSLFVFERYKNIKYNGIVN